MAVEKCYSCGKKPKELFRHKGIAIGSGSHYYCAECLKKRGIKVTSLLSNRRS